MCGANPAYPDHKIPVGFPPRSTYISYVHVYQASRAGSIFAFGRVPSGVAGSILPSIPVACALGPWVDSTTMSTTSLLGTLTSVELRVF